MKLATRMWLLGAVVPALGVLLGLVVAGQWFRHELEAAVDRALLAQAAVESVSLFDGPGGRVHLHMATSPLIESVRLFAPTGDLFGPDGRQVMSYPPRVLEPGQSPELLHPGPAGQPPALRTRKGAGGVRQRELLVTVSAPRGGLFTLRLTASLAQLDGSARAFYQTTLSLAALFGALLFVVQALQARQLKLRLAVLRAHIASLREGQLDRNLADDPRIDEIGELHRVLRETTAKLRAARSGQERLLADAAHELRTPLGLMRTTLDLALRRQRPVDELRASMEEVRREVIRLGVLCQQLLDRFALGQVDWDRVPVSLHALATEAAQAARAEAELHGVLIEICGTTDAHIRGHAPALRQALDNLLSNALRYAPRGSSISVQVVRAEGLVRLAVCDGGPGVASELRASLFAPFRREARATTNLREGCAERSHFGLGLHITQEIVARHAGRIFLDESAPRGARFVIEFPSL
jgi:signal transduction histidine kinase